MYCRSAATKSASVNVGRTPDASQRASCAQKSCWKRESAMPPGLSAKATSESDAKSVR